MYIQADKALSMSRLALVFDESTVEVMAIYFAGQ